MIISDLILALEALAALIGSPFFSGLAGFFILDIEVLLPGIFLPYFSGFIGGLFTQLIYTRIDRL